MNKKGTTMVEAAIIFPLIILVISGMIYFLIFLYSQAADSAEMHMAMRKEAGEVNQTLEYLTRVDPPFPVYETGKQIQFEGDVVLMKRGILKGINQTLSGHYYVIKGKDLVRLTDFGK